MKAKAFTKLANIAAAAVALCLGCSDKPAVYDCGFEPDDPEGVYDNVQATLRGGTLTISGEGKMVDFFNDHVVACGEDGCLKTPWSGDTSITKVIITEGVTSIGAEAFRDCPNLESVSIAKSVTEFVSNAFTECPRLSAIIALPQSPPASGGGFESYGPADYGLEAVCLYVPQERMEAYKSAAYWKGFSCVKPTTEARGKAPKKEASAAQPAAQDDGARAEVEVVVADNNGGGNKCGGENDHYDPERHFCVNDTLYYKCAGKEYDPRKHGCVGATDFDEELYDREKSFAYAHIGQYSADIYDKCGGKEYNPATQYCQNNTVQDNKCGDANYDTDTQFCHADKIYDKCVSWASEPPSRNEYNPDTHVCKEVSEDGIGNTGKIVER